MTRMQLRTKAWFGDEDLTIDFPASWKLVEIGPRDEPALTVEAMRECLSRPIGTRRLSEIARGKRNAVIMVDDLTRPTPGADLLPLLVEELTSGGIPAHDITVMLAGGTHPPASADERAKKVASRL